MSKLVAIVTTKRDKIDGGTPIFFADNDQECQEIALKLEKIIDASAHDLQNGTIILVEHPD